MKYFLFIYFVATSSSLFSQNGSKNNQDPADFFQSKYNAAIGKPFPEFLANLEGKKITNETIKGKTVYINFWFEACEPCLAEFDALNDLNQKLKDNKNFVFLSFTYETPQKIKEIKEKYKLNFQIISLPNQECFKLNQGMGYPSHFIIKDLIVSYVISGGSKDKDIARQMIFDDIYPMILKNLQANN